MKITKKLKHATIDYDEQTQRFFLKDTQNERSIELNKIYAFAFMRFVVRISQKNWLKGKKVVDKIDEDMVEYMDNPNQTILNIYE